MCANNPYYLYLQMISLYTFGCLVFYDRNFELADYLFWILFVIFGIDLIIRPPVIHPITKHIETDPLISIKIM